MESLLKLRVPATIVALIVLAGRLVLVPVLAVVYLGSDLSGGLSNMASLASYRSIDPLLVVVLTGLVASCVLVAPSRHSRTLAAVALVVVGVGVLVGAGFALIGLADGSALSFLNTLDQLGNFVVPVIALVALVKLRTLAPAGAAAYGVPQGAQPPMLPGPGLPPQPDAQYQPTWLPDAAAGAAWQSAGEAAAGAPASGWGTPGQSGGWQVEPGQQAPPVPPAAVPPGWGQGQSHEPPRWEGQQPPAEGWNPPRS